VLNTPVPGEYLISWATSDQCGLLPRSPTGFGVLVAQFELTQSAAAPTQLGTVSVIKSSYFEGEVPAGTGGHCEPVFEHEKRFDLSLHVALNGTVEPWSRNLANALYVDEQLFYGWSKLKPGQIDQNTFQYDFSVPCENGIRSLSDGIHTAQLASKIDNSQFAEFSSNKVEFEINCTAPDSVPPIPVLDEPEPSGL
jgi:hypothetical protein